MKKWTKADALALYPLEGRVANMNTSRDVSLRMGIRFDNAHTFCHAQTRHYKDCIVFIAANYWDEFGLFMNMPWIQLRALRRMRPADCSDKLHGFIEVATYLRAMDTLLRWGARRNRRRCR